MCTLRHISNVGGIKYGCRLVDASSPNFKALANVIKAAPDRVQSSEKHLAYSEEATTLQTLLPVRHSVANANLYHR